MAEVGKYGAKMPTLSLGKRKVTGKRTNSIKSPRKNYQEKVGWGTDQRGFGEEPGMKAQVINLIRSVRTVMRIPLIGVNTVMILLKLVFG